MRFLSRGLLEVPFPMVFLLSPTQRPAPRSSGFIHLSGMLRAQFSAFFFPICTFLRIVTLFFFLPSPPLSPIYPVKVSVWMPPTRLEPNISNMIFLFLFLSINLPLMWTSRGPGQGSGSQSRTRGRTEQREAAAKGTETTGIWGNVHRDGAMRLLFGGPQQRCRARRQI